MCPANVSHGLLAKTATGSPQTGLHTVLLRRYPGVMQAEDYLRRSPGYLSSSLSPRERVFLTDICHSPIAPRRIALKCLRTGCHPRDNARLSVELGITASSSFTTFPSGGAEIRNYYQWLDALQPSFLSPVLSSWFSSMIRSSPFFTPNWEQLETDIRRESAEKEAAACTSSPILPMLNFSSWFGSRDQLGTPLHPLLGSRPASARLIRRRLSEWREKMRDRVLYPIASKKHGSQSTDSDLSLLTGQPPGHYTSDDYELYYHHTGVMPKGQGVEMRQAWFYNDLKARTYYAYSGESYEKSRFVQPIFNSLLDAFQTTHRFKRFRMDRLDLLEDHALLIYDFSSFTSSLEQQRAFIEELAIFTDEVPIFLFDSFMGYTQTTLGSLLREYNSLNEHFPCLPSAALASLGLQEFFHTKAGYLGVHGNLASCTLLHGLLALTITEDERLASVVGDDGMIAVHHLGPLNLESLDSQPAVEEEEEEGEIPFLEEVLHYLRLIGSIASDKSSTTVLGSEDVCWSYLKRPVRSYRDPSDGRVHLTLDVAYPFPTSGLLLPENMTTRRKPGWDTPLERGKAFLNQVAGLRKTLSLYPPSASEVEFLLGYFEQLYRQFQIPVVGIWEEHRTQLMRGKFPLRAKFPGESVTICMPPLPVSFDDLVLSRRDILARMPSPPLSLMVDDTNGEDLYDRDLDAMEVGDVVGMTNSPRLKALSRLNFVSMSRRRVVCRSPEEFSQYLFPDRRYPTVYDVRLERRIPYPFTLSALKPIYPL